MEYGTGTWLPQFTNGMERKISAACIKAKGATSKAKALIEKYKIYGAAAFTAGGECFINQAAAALSKSMVTVSECLLLKALASVDPIGETRSQLARMQNQRVSAIHPALLQRCNKAIMGL